MLYAGIPAATIATTRNGLASIDELEHFLSETDSLEAYNGGDGPERQLQALLTILDLKASDGSPVMIPGSEIVLLTDASSHDEKLKSFVINNANESKVCISFYLSFTNWAPYIEISAKTGGTTVQGIDQDAFLSFEAEHVYGQCAEFRNLPTFTGRRKRLAFSSSYATEQRCHSFTTSLLTTKLKVYGYTSEDTMIVRDPHELEIHVINIRGEKIYEKTSPISGRWSVCVENGILTISVDTTDKINSILQYIKPLGVLPILSFSHSPPTACTLILF